MPPNDITDHARAIWITRVDVTDPDTNATVTLAVYKHDNGGIFAIDESFIDDDHGGDFARTDDEDDDIDNVILFDQFAHAFKPPQRVRLFETKAVWEAAAG